MHNGWRWASPARGPLGYSCNEVQQFLWQRTFGEDALVAAELERTGRHVAVAPLDRIMMVLDAIRLTRAELDLEVESLVAAGRGLDVSWGELARFMRCTPQAAQQKFSRASSSSASERERTLGWRSPAEGAEAYIVSDFQDLLVVEGFLGMDAAFRMDSHPAIERLLLVLEACQEVRATLHLEVESLAADGRSRGATWAALGKRLGFSAQAAQKRYRQGLSEDARRYMDEQMAMTVRLRKSMLRIGMQSTFADSAAGRAYRRFLDEQSLVEAENIRNRQRRSS